MNLLRDLPYDVISEKDKTRHPLRTYNPPKDISMICVFGVPPEKVVEVEEKLATVAGISAHAAGSWIPGKQDIHITHELATKKHAMEALLGHINIPIHEVMVVGDSNNDLPLFELAGFKIAMGNATDKVKKTADWIAPTLEENGLAVAINKYILQK